MIHEDPQTYKRATGAALFGLAVQTLFLAAFGGVALFLEPSPALTAAIWYAGGGLLLWLMLAIVYSQHRMERLEALEAEQLAQRHGSDSSIFENSAEDLSLARRRVRRLYRWGLPATSIITAGYLLGMGLYLLLMGRKILFLLNVSTSDLLPNDPRLATLKDIIGADTKFELLPNLMGLVISRHETFYYLIPMIGLTLAGFIASRYLAGMASVRQWKLLRGGAGYIMGNVLTAALLALAYALVMFDMPGFLKYLMVIIPMLMVVIGIEMAINIVLEIYRPRKANEVPRPAFDSRVLSLLTAPESIARTINETINYQFGFEITKSWFWQLLSKAFGYLVMLGAVILILLSSVVIVSPHEQAVVTRFGRLVSEQPLDSGLYFKWPWPIDRVTRYQVHRIQTVPVGSHIDLKPNVPVLWTNEHSASTPERLIVAPPSSMASSDQDAKDSKTPSISLVNAEIVVDYHIGNLIDYITSAGGDRETRRADRRLQNLATAEVSRYLYTQDIDAWIGAARVDAGREMAQRVQAAADQAKLGLVIDGVRFKSIHPPQEQEVALSFQKSVGAQQEKIQKIEEARKASIGVLTGVAGSVEQANQIKELIAELDQLKDDKGSPQVIEAKTADLEKLLYAAGGQAAQVLGEARSYRWQRENAERAAASSFEKELLAYHSAPQLYASRKYLQVFTEGLIDARKYLLLADRDQTIIRINFEELTGLDLNLGENP